MKYTVRFAHLEKPPDYKVGDIIKRGDVVGKMGSSGQSTAKHLHIDCVFGYQKESYTLADIERGTQADAPRQLNFFIDRELFGQMPVITTYYNDPTYQATRKKLHSAYDLVPVNRHEPGATLLIYWNRSVEGKVLRIDDDPKGYGHCIYIGFEI